MINNQSGAMFPEGNILDWEHPRDCKSCARWYPKDGSGITPCTLGGQGLAMKCGNWEQLSPAPCPLCIGGRLEWVEVDEDGDKGMCFRCDLCGAEFEE
jgi:hypothetical protein